MGTSLRHLHIARFRASAAGALLLATVTGCATVRGQAHDHVGTERAVAFENATIDQVAVYLHERGSQWLLGHVQPGRSVLLTLPTSFAASRISEATLVAVPLGTRSDGARGGQVESAVRSELEPTEHLVTMRWTLRGARLVGSMPPGGR